MAFRLPVHDGLLGHAPASEVFPSAKHLALQALAIDDSLSRAHLVHAWMCLLLDWDVEAAVREARRAIELSPSETDAHSFYSTLLSFVGHEAEAMREVQCVLKLNPAPLLPNQYAAWMFLHMGRHGRAEAQARRTIARFPDALQPYFVLGWSAWYQRRAEDAVAAFENALSRSREALSLSYLGHVYGRLGRTDDARRLFGELEQLRSRGQAPPVAFAIIHAGIGDIDAAFEWLETAYRLRDGSLFWLAGTPGLDLPSRRRALCQSRATPRDCAAGRSEISRASPPPSTREEAPPDMMACCVGAALLERRGCQPGRGGHSRRARLALSGRLARS